MVWGFVKYDGWYKRPPKISGIMNSRLYKITLVETLLPRFYLGEKFQQDNAPYHVSAGTMTFFGKLYQCCDRLAITISGSECYREFVGNSEKSGLQKDSEKH